MTTPRFYYGQSDYIQQLNYLDGIATSQAGPPGPAGPTGDVTPAATDAAAAAVAARDTTLTYRDATLVARDLTLGYRDTTLTYRDATLAARDLTLGYRDTTLGYKDSANTSQGLASGYATTTLGYRDTALAARDTTLTYRDATLAARDLTLGYRDAAATSATNAAGSAAALSATSTSSLLIATGAKTFATQTGKQFNVGQFFLAVSAANSANYMYGQVTSYGAGSLVSNVLAIGGAGTLADWNISVSGLRGATGAKGLNWRGAWAGATAYLTDDLATNAGSTWRRKTDGTSATAPGSDATNWEIAALKGTDGAGSVVTVNSVSPDGGGNVALVTTNLPEGTNLYYTAARVLAEVLTGLSTATNAVITATDTVLTAAGKLQKQISDLLALKDATGGYAGLTLFKINFKNTANTFTSFFTNANTAARTYTFQDRDGTIADAADLALKLSLAGGSMTGAIKGNTPQTIALAATINLTSATSNYIMLGGGSGPVSAFTIAAGSEFTLRWATSVTVTHSSGALILPGAADINVLIGDVWTICADAANVVRVTGIVSVATSTEIKQAFSNSKTITPVGLNGALGLSAYVQIADQTITAAGAVTVAHNLGRTPILMLGFMKCVVDEGSFIAGDVIPISLGATQIANPGNYGVGVRAGASNISIRYGSQATATILMIDDGTGVTFAATNSKWRFFVRAWG